MAVGQFDGQRVRWADGQINRFMVRRNDRLIYQWIDECYDGQLDDGQIERWTCGMIIRYNQVKLLLCRSHFYFLLPSTASFNPAEAELCSIFIFSSHPPGHPPTQESIIQIKIDLDLKSKVVNLNGQTLKIFLTSTLLFIGAI